MAAIDVFRHLGKSLISKSGVTRNPKNVFSVKLSKRVGVVDNSGKGRGEQGVIILG